MSLQDAAAPVQTLPTRASQIMSETTMTGELGVAPAGRSGAFSRTLPRSADVPRPDRRSAAYSLHPALLVKRFVDIVGAVTALVLTAPIMLIAAAVIKLESEGSVMFRQVRVGMRGRRFSMLKLRTMCPDAEARKQALAAQNEMSGPVFKVTDDPRVTRVGRFLRKYSIDELPQLLHVLRGDLSLVGPRPALPEEVARYEPWQQRRLVMKPGLTCLWQVNGRNELDFEDWMRLDLEYIHHWSLWLDLRILLKTIPAVLRGTGV